jgi:hypothetical protein
MLSMKALHRHDLDDWSCVNKEIKILNRLLAKRLKLYKPQLVGYILTEKVSQGMDCT